jgi:hypothetical protein
MNASDMNYTEIHQQAHTLLRGAEWTQAEALLRTALMSGSGPIPLWHQLFYAIRHLGKVDEARHIIEMIVQTVPGNMSARFDLAEVLLLQGEFTRGWQEYRFRYKLEHTTMIARHVQKPRWEGQPIRDKILLIHDEQGYGDTFQFLRMAAWARERSGARVILEVNPDTYSLAKRCEGYDEITMRGSIPPYFDLHCELMSLPMAMGLKPNELPGPTMPYLSPDPQRLEKWRARLADLPRPLVGLVWAGRPTHTNDVRRSITLNDLAPIAQPGITFVALQKGPAAAQAAAPPPEMSLVSLSDEINDFEDTAAILMLLDTLISVDSSPVHLAGALGRPAWVMLPFMPDWRWQLNRTDTSWYPTVRLFRQPAPDQWQAVLESIAAELGALKGAR